MKGNQLPSGSYTSIFEIFVIGDAGGFRVDDTIICKSMVIVIIR